MKKIAEFYYWHAWIENDHDGCGTEGWLTISNDYVVISSAYMQWRVIYSVDDNIWSLLTAILAVSNHILDILILARLIVLVPIPFIFKATCFTSQVAPTVMLPSGKLTSIWLMERAKHWRKFFFTIFYVFDKIFHT